MSAREIAGKLTKAQRKALRASKPSMDARVLVPAAVGRDRWPADLIDIYSVAYRRLTPLGLAVRTILQEQPHD